MTIKILRKRLAITACIGLILSGIGAYAAVREMFTTNTVANPELSGGPASVTMPNRDTDPRKLIEGSQMVSAVQPDVVAEWNAEAVRLTLLTSSAQAPVQQTRTMAIVHVSVHDAVNGLTREYKTYLPPGAAPDNASPEAAAIAAAHHALRNLFPAHAMTLDPMFLASLAAHGLTVDNPGVGYGQLTAAAILANRADDGSAVAQFPYTAPGAGLPGIWVPLTAQPALLAGWGDVVPWSLRSGAQFRPEAPPAFDSEQYARDYNEIKEIGSLTSTTRTAVQTQIATFWLASPTAIWNQPLRQLVAASDFDLSTRARTYALMYLSAADSSIACWEAKYEYNFWRPQPAIRRGDEDGNDATIADPTWTPLFATPRHPEYPSGHTANSTAMATVLAFVFGDEPGMPITSTIGSITREWDNFDEGLDEVIDARVYSGIHFRTADVAGSKQGLKVARFVWKSELRICPRGRGFCR